MQQAIVTRAGTYLKGPRYHAIRFEPWPGGPSAAVTWTVPRRCLAPYQEDAVDSCNGAGDRVLNATNADLVSSSVSESAPVETIAVPPEKGPSRGGATSDARAEADGFRSAMMSQLPGSTAPYPPGTIVAVRSLDVDPGRTLKFARDETYEAAFKELVGREVSGEEAVVDVRVNREFMFEVAMVHFMVICFYGGDGVW